MLDYNVIYFSEKKSKILFLKRCYGKTKKWKHEIICDENAMRKYVMCLKNKIHFGLNQM